MMTKKKEALRWGFTTGTAAAAAAKGALLFLIDGTPTETIPVTLPDGAKMRIPVHALALKSKIAQCSVIKDAGDDPDVTHRAEIGARVWLESGTDGHVTISGGEGVGVVTKPGLGILVGEPAMTRVPREMIVSAIRETLTEKNVAGSAHVEIFVPKGVELAKKTLNARLGILGGISILGTTGRVKPISHDAYIASIHAALSVAKAAGVTWAVLTTGRRSERFAQGKWADLPAEAFVQIGDFFKSSLEKVSENEFEQAIIAVFFGKAVKMARGDPHTHAAKSDMPLRLLAQIAFDVSGDRDFCDIIRKANTVRHAFDLIRPAYPKVFQKVGERLVTSAERFAGPKIKIRGVVFDFDGKVVFDSDSIGGPPK